MLWGSRAAVTVSVADAGRHPSIRTERACRSRLCVGGPAAGA